MTDNDFIFFLFLRLIASHPHLVIAPLLLCPLSPTIQEAFQIGIYWAHTNTVHKSTALKLVHDLTSPRWKEGSGSEVVTLDEEGYVEADITLGAFPGKQKVRETIFKL